MMRAGHPDRAAPGLAMNESPALSARLPQPASKRARNQAAAGQAGGTASRRTADGHILSGYDFGGSVITTKLQGARRAVSFARPAGRVAATFGAIIAANSVANAQPLPVYTPETLLLQPGTKGVRAGNVLIYPQLDFDLEQDSNIYNLDDNKVDDTVFVVRPSVRIRPDTARHEFVLEANGQLRRYFDVKSENSDQYGVGARTRLDFAERTAATASLRYAHRIEPRGSYGDSLESDQPIEYDTLDGAAGLQRTGGILELRTGGNFRQTRYDDATLDGVRLDTSWRDVDNYGGFARADYRVSPKLRTFVELKADWTDYRSEPDVPRDSNGYGALVGLRMEVSELIDGEIAVGYAHRNFDDPAADSFDGVDFRVSGRWTPTPRWQFGLEGQRRFDRSPLANVPTVLATRLRFVAQRSLGRRFLVGTEVTYDNWDYRGITRKETRIGGDATLRYLVTDQLTAFAAAGYRDQSGSGDNARNYSGSNFRIGLSIAL
ncbi:hypothetical protein GCM10010990_22080 [Croceicoccus mobilis]|uniref:Uncharacterized protein n=2 Tax=Croceicoccus mobilis TaxID=1703339 RepID=A0A916Z1G4_9SPHN|nr:outer membrane beta-barrel protein [Croceicoccus mobilis]GGD72181.1 hypothetical protein GCM10010990_22080 [Croceicoccus mobilis]